MACPPAMDAVNLLQMSIDTLLVCNVQTCRPYSQMSGQECIELSIADHISTSSIWAGIANMGDIVALKSALA